MDTRHCPNCLMLVPNEVDTCPYCGFDLDGPSPEEQVFRLKLKKKVLFGTDRRYLTKGKGTNAFNVVRRKT